MARKKGMTEEQLASMVGAAVDDAINYDATELIQNRAKALEYFRGELRDVPSQDGFSRVTSRDLSDTVGWILPGLLRVFAGSETLGTYEPMKPQDEEFSQQATDYVNFVFHKECQGYRVLADSLQDSLMFGNGIVKHWWDPSKTYETASYTGLDEIAYQTIVMDDDIEVLQHTAYPDDDAIAQQQQMEAAGHPIPTQVDEETGLPIAAVPMLHDLKVKRTCSYGAMKVVSVPPEEFLIERGAVDIEDASFVCHRSMRTRQSLISEGFDREKVMDCPAESRTFTTAETNARWNRINVDRTGNGTDPLIERVECFESYIRVDFDGDGYAEWRRVITIGANDETHVLANEEWEDDVPFSDFVPMPEPHRWNGRSLYNELEDIQRVKTVLLRQTLDNLYLSNRPQREVVSNQVLNMDELTSPSVGGIVFTKAPGVIRDMAIPFVGDKSYAMMEYMDSLSEKRTGVSRQSMALDPDALQHQTASGQMMAQSAAYAKIELYARNIAEIGMRRMFKCLLKIIVAHQDRARIIRLRDQWVEMDPRGWNANMDVSINVGLGSGSRDKDLMLLQQIVQKQEFIIAQGGPDNPLVTPIQYANTLRKMVESAGIRNPDAYFSEVNEDDVKALAEKAQGKVDPKVQAAQAQMQIEQQKAQADMQFKQASLQADMQAKQAQMQFDQQSNREKNMADLAADREKMALQMQLMQQKAAADLEIQRQKAQVDMQLRQQEMAMEAQLTQQANLLKAATDSKAKADENVAIPGKAK